jgi:CBS domain-containing protein
VKTVADIMIRDVIHVRPETTIRELAEILADSQISGAPVMDSANTLIGVVSATDIVRLASEGVVPDGEGWDGSPQEESLPDYVPSFFRDAGTYAGAWTPLSSTEQHPATFDELTVKDIMTSVPFTVPADTSVALLASFLSERRIHRAIVTGPHGLAGIVTTFDVLRACADILAPVAEA